ncbi:Variable major outer membrane lipoprotein [Borrelia crocidurae DOU]|uniref:Variable major outer membrane lipoprotein n=1 Tax=Borrelia crocidurae DOU TaxID=1293575 RepID=W5SHD9_9SPIR|nr:hypothetical protein [Borrelia crocidurae]AHH06068.1 Variable major outer membrane lipoprotein [Borrelia crocidurae DOU]
MNIVYKALKGIMDTMETQQFKEPSASSVKLEQAFIEVDSY